MHRGRSPDAPHPRRRPVCHKPKREDVRRDPSTSTVTLRTHIVAAAPRRPYAHDYKLPGKEETNLAAIACVLALPRAALQWALLGFVVVLA
ncbi:hypothetical protein DFH09DRAFT_1345242 [Mycena vulgaris]|nr:hypothetical protein DFH09DRAFT_1345242 [Mycena vulgaris]